FVVTHSHSNDPLICAAGVASLDVIQEEDVPAKARAIGEHLKERLEALAQRYEMVGDVRGRGMLQGIELVKDRKTKAPATEEGQAMARHCLEGGLIFSQRRGGSIFRFVPPATTTAEQIEEAMDILTAALEQVSVRGATAPGAQPP
ncbi:MAG: aminotransferase class III-fold pyridoxal phosphate-dependent enzyme, partial [Nitrospinota bacterium]